MSRAHRICNLRLLWAKSLWCKSSRILQIVVMTECLCSYLRQGRSVRGPGWRCGSQDTMFPGIGRRSADTWYSANRVMTKDSRMSPDFSRALGRASCCPRQSPWSCRTVEGLPTVRIGTWQATQNESDAVTPRGFAFLNDESLCLCIWIF